MSQELADRIARAVLYEGYLHYPYRPSVKSRHRWTFGGLYPPAWSAASGGAEPSELVTECLVTGEDRAAIEVKVRFLHLIQRTVGALETPASRLPADRDPPWREVESLNSGEEWIHTWQEASECAAILPAYRIGELEHRPRQVRFDFPAQRERAPIPGPGGQVVGLVIREARPIRGVVEVSARRIEGRLHRLTVRVQNLTELEDPRSLSRDQAVLLSLASAHVVLHARGAEFISLLEPPEDVRDQAAACRNVGVWPVLVGTGTEKDTMLGSPIILYDYPQVAAESPGDFFDSTEIDEMLVLRIQTLTEDEKRLMAAVDERARELLERTEALSPASFLGLHATMRGVGKSPGGGKT